MLALQSRPRSGTKQVRVLVGHCAKKSVTRYFVLYYATGPCQTGAIQGVSTKGRAVTSSGNICIYMYACLLTKIIPLYFARKKKKKNLTEQEKDLNSVFESVEKYLNELMLNLKVVKFSVIIKLYKVTKKLQFDETDIQSLKKKSKNFVLPSSTTLANDNDRGLEEKKQSSFVA